MYLELCKYNTLVPEKLESTLNEIYSSIDMDFSGIAIPLFILRRIYQDISSVDDYTIAVPIDYPLGMSDEKVRAHESIRAMKSNANRIDITVNPYLIENERYSEIQKEFSSMIRICEDYAAIPRPIINFDFFDLKKSILCCRALEDAGISCIISCSGLRNVDISDSIMFCRSIEEKTNLSTICSGSAWLEKHHKAVIGADTYGFRVYSIKSLF
jgi:deoxyribose-phosphate aldolase